jgi:hypothetical protein
MIWRGPSPGPAGAKHSATGPRLARPIAARALPWPKLRLPWSRSDECETEYTYETVTEADAENAPEGARGEASAAAAGGAAPARPAGGAAAAAPPLPSTAAPEARVSGGRPGGGAAVAVRPSQRPPQRPHAALAPDRHRRRRALQRPWQRAGAARRRRSGPRPRPQRRRRQPRPPAPRRRRPGTPLPRAGRSHLRCWRPSARGAARQTRRASTSRRCRAGRRRAACRGASCGRSGGCTWRSRRG